MRAISNFALIVFFTSGLTLGSTMSGSGSSTLACVGGPAWYCARTDMGGIGLAGVSRTGSPLFSGNPSPNTQGAAGSCAVDPNFGELMCRGTDEFFSSLTGSGPTFWTYSDLADEGQAQDISFNDDLFLIKGAGGTEPAMFYFNPSTHAGARVDVACGSFNCTGFGLSTITSLSGPQFSHVTENTLYGVCTTTEIGLCTSTLSGTGTNQRTLSSATSMFNFDTATGGWMSQSAKWTVAPPVLTLEAQNCTPAAGQVCARTSGGSLADGTYEVAFVWRDATDSPTTEQNINSASSIATFAAEVTISGGGGNGSIIGLPPSTTTGLGLTPDSYSIYALKEATSANWPGSCTGVIGAVACPKLARWQMTVSSTASGFTLTSLNTASHTNESCGKTHDGSKCGIGSFEFDAGDGTFFASTGGVAQEDYVLLMACNASQGGCRWLDLTQGTVSNQSGAWTGYPTGTLVYGGFGGGDDDCQALLQTTSPCSGWQPTGIHNFNATLSKTDPYVLITVTNQTGQPVQPGGLLAWEANTLNVSTLFANHSASSASFPYNGGHIGVGYSAYVGVPQQYDLNDIRSKNMSTFWSATSSQLLTTTPSPFPFLCQAGDQHMNWADANAANTMPWFNFPYQLISRAACGVTLSSSGGVVTTSTPKTGAACTTGTSLSFLAATNNGSIVDPTPENVVVANASDPTCNGVYTVRTSTWSSATMTWSANAGTCTSGATGATIWPTNFQNTAGGPLGPIHWGRALIDELWAGFSTPGLPAYRVADMDNDATTDTGAYTVGTVTIPNEFGINPRGHCSVDGRVCMFTSNMFSSLGIWNSPATPRSDVFIVYIR